MEGYLEGKGVSGQWQTVAARRVSGGDMHEPLCVARMVRGALMHAVKAWPARFTHSSTCSLTVSIREPFQALSFLRTLVRATTLFLFDFGIV